MFPITKKALDIKGFLYFMERRVKYTVPQSACTFAFCITVLVIYLKEQDLRAAARKACNSVIVGGCHGG